MNRDKVKKYLEQLDIQRTGNMQLRTEMSEKELFWKPRVIMACNA